VKWDKTTACECRYGDVIGRVFASADIICEDSKADYQGYAEIIARFDNGVFVHYNWNYGSCSGCDSWEALESTDDEILMEVRRTMGVLPTLGTLVRYITEFPDNSKLKQRALVWVDSQPC